MKLEITADVAHRLGHYVYAYVDPRNGEVFYVGKGVGSRATAHLDESGESRKVQRIAAIRDAGLDPQVEIVAHGLRDEEEAFRVEAALIELLGTKQLTNEVRGWGAVTCARKPLRDFIVECRPREIEITDPTLLIRINRLFRYGMTGTELYEATRGVWVIGPRRRKAKFAMPVYAGIIREVYSIEKWHSAGSTDYQTRDTEALRQQGRWEFVGGLAEPAIRDRYVGGSSSATSALASRTRSWPSR